MHTDKITLRSFRPEDRSIILDILTDDTVKQTYMLPDFEKREDAIPLFSRLSELSDDNTRFVRCICLKDRAVGFLNDVQISGTKIELGYVIHPAYQGKGYMTAALTEAIRELPSLGYRQLLAGAFRENTASIRVMERCGMVPTGETETIPYRGQDHGCVYYSIPLNPEIT